MQLVTSTIRIRFVWQSYKDFKYYYQTQNHFTKYDGNKIKMKDGLLDHFQTKMFQVMVLIFLTKIFQKTP